MPTFPREFNRRPAILDGEGNFYTYNVDTHNLDLVTSDISDSVIGSFTKLNEGEVTICRYNTSNNKLYGMIVSDWVDETTPIFSEREVFCDKPYMAKFDTMSFIEDEVQERRYLIGSAIEDDTYLEWQPTIPE